MDVSARDLHLCQIVRAIVIHRPLTVRNVVFRHTLSATDVEEIPANSLRAILQTIGEEATHDQADQ
jgi:hypothetical protein